MAGDAENDNGIASDGGWEPSRDLDGDEGAGDRDVAINKDGVGAEEGSEDAAGVVGEADVDPAADTSALSDAAAVVGVTSSGSVAWAAAVVVVVAWPLL